MQPETKYWWVIFIPVLASVRGMAPETTPVLAVGVTADLSVEQVPLERFDGMTKSELWDDPRYDREHSWPKSRGFKKDTKKNPAYSDCRHLYAAYSSYNSSRSNKPYGEHAANAAARRMTMENLGRGGSLTDEPCTSNYSFDSCWQAWIGRRGDVPRAMFYMDVRYEDEVTGNVGAPDLVLTNDANEIRIRDDAWKAGAKRYMGMLNVLLKWQEQDMVDDVEREDVPVVGEN